MLEPFSWDSGPKVYVRRTSECVAVNIWVSSTMMTHQEGPDGIDNLKCLVLEDTEEIALFPKKQTQQKVK